MYIYMAICKSPPSGEHLIRCSRKKRLATLRKEPYRYALANSRGALASGTVVYICKMSPIK